MKIPFIRRSKTPSSKKNNITHIQYHLGFFDPGESEIYGVLLRKYLTNPTIFGKIIYFYELSNVNITTSFCQRNWLLGKPHHELLLSKLKSCIFLSFRSTAVLVNTIHIYIKTQGPGFFSLDDIDLPKHVMIINQKMPVIYLELTETFELNFSLTLQPYSDPSKENENFLKNTKESTIHSLINNSPIKRVDFQTKSIVFPKHRENLAYEVLKLDIWAIEAINQFDYNDIFIKLILYEISKQFIKLARIRKGGYRNY